MDLWDELVEKFTAALENSLETVKGLNVDNIPGAKEQLIRRFEELIRYLPKDNGAMLVKSIDESISNAFFPQTNDFSEAFAKILQSRTHEQDFLIGELINGFISSQAKSFGSFKEGPVIDRIIEAFKKSKNFKISDQKFYAMFGVKSNQNPRKNLVEKLGKITEFLGLIEEEFIIKRDVHRSEEKIVKFYTFPPEVLVLLEGTYIIQTDKGETIVNEDFDKNVFVCLFLARYAVQRKELDSYKINGISAIFALVLILSFMPKVKLGEDSPILRDPSYNASTMSVIPKGWMAKSVLAELMPPCIEIVAYRLGAARWHGKIELSEAQKRLHLQTRFLIKDINKWVLGNLCRVEIPIFVEISNIFQEITVSGGSTLDE